MENSIARERLASELSERKAKTDRLNAKIDSLNKEISLDSLESKKAMNDELVELRMEEERLKLANSVALKKIKTEINQLRLEDARLKPAVGEIGFRGRGIDGKTVSQRKKRPG